MKLAFFGSALLCAALLVPSIVHAADANKSATAPAASNGATTDTESKADTGKVKGRLPSGWGKLGITDVQKQAIYKVQATYEAQISALRKQLTDLEAKQETEMRNVLTAAQQKQLDDAVSTKSSKKASANSKNGMTATSASASKP